MNAKSQAAPLPGNDRGRHVLLVDDDPINNLICEEMLRHSGVASQVSSFLKPRAALAWLQQQDAAGWPEMLLLDINMPELNGWEFLEGFRKLQLKRPLSIWILSSSLCESDQTRAREHPLIEDYLIKPLTPALLARLGAGQTSLPAVA